MQEIKKILHVEDDPSLQRLVRIALEQIGGYAVQTAADGEQGLALAAETTPDLVLLDLNLPGINGVETLRGMRAIAALRDVPVVFLTATTDPELLSELSALRVSEVVIKPFRPRSLVETIDRVMGDKKNGT